MQSTIQLFNAALAKLGGEQLPQNRSALENDTTGILCENIFPHILDLALSAHQWGFAKRRARLAMPVQEQTFNPAYAYAYSLPADCIKPIAVSGRYPCVSCGYGAGEQDEPFILEGGLLLCGSAAAELVYVARVTDPKLWPAAFSEALVWKLASELASARLNDANKQRQCEQMYTYFLNEAVARDRAMQRPRKQATAWQTARGNGAGGNS